MKKWNLIVDVARCENCNNCFLSCKDEYVGNDFPGYSAAQPLHGHRWIDLYRKERGQVPMVDHASMPATCNQCDNAPCIEAAGDGSVYKRPDGIVIIDPERARGRKDLVEACPYGAIWWNEELELPQKWTFDAHLLDAGWTEPRCVQACPTGALRPVNIEDDELERLIEEEELEVLSPELGTRPRVYYRNLYLMTRCFIGGTVITRAMNVEDCVAGLDVALYQGEERIAVTTTDAFGEFRFDKLEPDSGQYEVRCGSDGDTEVRVQVELGESTYIGVIEFSRADPAAVEVTDGPASSSGAAPGITA